jgi:hypothetical protein
VNEKIAVVHQYPLGVLVSLDAGRALANVDQPFPDRVADGLYLPGVCSVTNDKEVGERRDLTKIQNANIVSFFRCRGMYGGNPRRLSRWRGLKVNGVFGQ